MRITFDELCVLWHAGAEWQRSSRKRRRRRKQYPLNLIKMPMIITNINLASARTHTQTHTYRQTSSPAFTHMQAHAEQKETMYIAVAETRTVYFIIMCVFEDKNVRRQNEIGFDCFVFVWCFFFFIHLILFFFFFSIDTESRWLRVKSAHIENTQTKCR